MTPRLKILSGASHFFPGFQSSRPLAPVIASSCISATVWIGILCSFISIRQPGFSPPHYTFPIADHTRFSSPLLFFSFLIYTVLVNTGTGALASCRPQFSMADDNELMKTCVVGGNPVSAFLSWRLQATNACDVTLVWKSGFDHVAQYGISFKYVAYSLLRPAGARLTKHSQVSHIWQRTI